METGSIVSDLVVNSIIIVPVKFPNVSRGYLYKAKIGSSDVCWPLLCLKTYCVLLCTSLTILARAYGNGMLAEGKGGHGGWEEGVNTT